MDPFAFGMPVGGMGPQRLMSGGMRGRMRPPAVHRGAMRGGLQLLAIHELFTFIISLTFTIFQD